MSNRHPADRRHAPDRGITSEELEAIVVEDAEVTKEVKRSIIELLPRGIRKLLLAVLCLLRSENKNRLTSETANVESQSPTRVASPTLSPKEVAIWLKVEVPQIYRLVKRKRRPLPSKRVGRYLRFDRDEVAEWLERERVRGHKKWAHLGEDEN